MLAPNRLHALPSPDDGRAVIKAPTLAVFDDDTTRVDLVAHPAGTGPNDRADGDGDGGAGIATAPSVATSAAVSSVGPCLPAKAPATPAHDGTGSDAGPSGGSTLPAHSGDATRFVGPASLRVGEPTVRGAGDGDVTRIALRGLPGPTSSTVALSGGPAEAQAAKAPTRPSLSIRRSYLVAGPLLLVSLGLALRTAHSRVIAERTAVPPTANPTASAPSPETTKAPLDLRTSPAFEPPGPAVARDAAALPPSPAPPHGPSLPPTAPADERAAVNAIASGSYVEAARLYHGLSVTHPSSAAYREAARILLRRSKESSR